MKGVVLSEEVIVLTYTTQKDAFLELTIPWMGIDNEKSNTKTINYIICKVVSVTAKGKTIESGQVALGKLRMGKSTMGRLVTVRNTGVRLASLRRCVLSKKGVEEPHLKSLREDVSVEKPSEGKSAAGRLDEQRGVQEHLDWGHRGDSNRRWRQRKRWE